MARDTAYHHMLTSDSLQLNEISQPKETFAYEVHEKNDSGYRSIGQASGLETEVPLEYHGGEPALTRNEADPIFVSPGELDSTPSNYDLTGLEMDPLEFPESVKMTRIRKYDFNERGL